MTYILEHVAIVQTVGQVSESNLAYSNQPESHPLLTPIEEHKIIRWKKYGHIMANRYGEAALIAAHPDSITPRQHLSIVGTQLPSSSIHQPNAAEKGRPKDGFSGSLAKKVWSKEFRQAATRRRRE